jgi:putative addiction module component (TIGR02574 family)
MPPFFATMASSKQRNTGIVMQTAELIALPLAERLEAMEALWESLCRDAPDSLLSPAWHADVLDARAKALESGADPTSPWVDVKQRIHAKRGT